MYLRYKEDVSEDLVYAKEKVEVESVKPRERSKLELAILLAPIIYCLDYIKTHPDDINTNIKYGVMVLAGVIVLERLFKWILR